MPKTTQNKTGIKITLSGIEKMNGKIALKSLNIEADQDITIDLQHNSVKHVFVGDIYTLNMDEPPVFEAEKVLEIIPRTTIVQFLLDNKIDDNE